MRIDIEAPEGNAFYIIGQTRQFLKGAGASTSQIEKVTKTMYDSSYELMLEVAATETRGWLEFYKDGEEYFVLRNEDYPDEQNELMKEFEILFQADFDPTPNGE